MNEPQYTLNVAGKHIPYLFFDAAKKEGFWMGMPFTISLIATGMICCNWQPGQAIEYTKAYQRWYKNQNGAGATRKERVLK
jgi:hypothetical protein